MSANRERRLCAGKLGAQALRRRTTVHRTVDGGQRVRHIGAVKCCAVKCALRVKQLRSEVCFASVF